MNAIEGVDLTRRYGGFVALDKVSIAVSEGQIHGLIGPNGAGKSTLIDVLSGRAARSTGTVRLFGEDISSLSVQERRRSGLARSFQRTNIFPALSVVEQLDLAARYAERPNVDEVLRELGLAPYALQRAADISYGDQRRLDLALALIGRPRVLLLDEPAAGLTMHESMEISEMLRDLTQRWGVTVLIVEHDMDVVFGICEHITVLHLGKILAEGSPQEIQQHPEVVTAYLGSAA
ncbi:MAG: ABC transporter ATP-binding protein [Roseovarius sp.]|nr:ABC transporter ATP-binding protein [Roseovarius sp.]